MNPISPTYAALPGLTDAHRTWSMYFQKDQNSIDKFLSFPAGLDFSIPPPPPTPTNSIASTNETDSPMVDAHAVPNDSTIDLDSDSIHEILAIATAEARNRTEYARLQSKKPRVWYTAEQRATHTYTNWREEHPSGMNRPSVLDIFEMTLNQLQREANFKAAELERWNKAVTKGKTLFKKGENQGLDLTQLIEAQFVLLTPVSKKRKTEAKEIDSDHATQIRRTEEVSCASSVSASAQSSLILSIGDHHDERKEDGLDVVMQDQPLPEPEVSPAPSVNTNVSAGDHTTVAPGMEATMMEFDPVEDSFAPSTQSNVVGKAEDLLSSGKLRLAAVPPPYDIEAALSSGRTTGHVLSFSDDYLATMNEASAMVEIMREATQTQEASFWENFPYTGIVFADESILPNDSPIGTMYTDGYVPEFAGTQYSHLLATPMKDLPSDFFDNWIHG